MENITSNGNKFLEITVKHGLNKCCGTWVNTERAEFEVQQEVKRFESKKREEKGLLPF